MSAWWQEKIAGRNTAYETERRARLAISEDDSSLWSGLRRCLSSGASAHSPPRTASPVPLYLSLLDLAMTVSAVFVYKNLKT